MPTWAGTGLLMCFAIGLVSGQCTHGQFDREEPDADTGTRVGEGQHPIDRHGQIAAGIPLGTLSSLL